MDDHSGRLRHHGLSRVVLQDARRICGHVREKQAVETGRSGENQHADRDRHKVPLQHFAKRLARGQLFHPRELRRFLERATQSKTDETAEAAEDERNPPAPGGHQIGRQIGAHRQADAGRHRDAHRDARENHAADERRNPRRGFDDVGQRARQLAAEAESLHDTKRHEQRARRHAPGGVGWHEAHSERRARHDENRNQEHAAPAVAIAKVAEDDAADRSREVADREGAERHHQRHQRRRVGKNRVRDVFGEDTEDDEVVELQCPAEAGEQDNPPPGRTDALRR